jgi:hypothetical protein
MITHEENLLLCQKRYWGEKHVKPSGLVFRFYFCPHCKKETYTDQEKLEQLVEREFEQIRLSSQYVEYVLATAQQLLTESRVVYESFIFFDKKVINRDLVAHLLQIQQVVYIDIIESN